MCLFHLCCRICDSELSNVYSSCDSYLWRGVFSLSLLISLESDAACCECVASVMEYMNLKQLRVESTIIAIIIIVMLPLLFFSFDCNHYNMKKKCWNMFFTLEKLCKRRHTHSFTNIQTARTHLELRTRFGSCKRFDSNGRCVSNWVFLLIAHLSLARSSASSPLCQWSLLTWMSSRKQNRTKRKISAADWYSCFFVFRLFESDTRKRIERMRADAHTHDV